MDTEYVKEVIYQAIADNCYEASCDTCEKQNSIIGCDGCALDTGNHCYWRLSDATIYEAVNQAIEQLQSDPSFCVQ